MGMNRIKAMRVQGSRAGRSGFTLVELLVVISIIALLISILLPSLKKARDSAKAVKCAANQKAVGTAVSTYLAEYNGVFPPSYVYPSDAVGSWSADPDDPDGQSTNKVYGYMHWSYFLFSAGKVKDESFQCPAMQNGGAPRTNPGHDPKAWEDGQVDDSGASTPSTTSIEDKQATRMAYTANAAIMPRNKFGGPVVPEPSGPRRNVLIRESVIKRPGDTILGTEFLDNFKAIGKRGNGGLVIKSHRPINVFYHIGSAFNEFGSPDSAAYFQYGKLTSLAAPETAEDYGVLPLNQIRNREALLDVSQSTSQINAIGRHHPGGDNYYGGTANFFFLDTHVERATPLQSMERRYWGPKYYSLTGFNDVINYSGRIN